MTALTQKTSGRLVAVALTIGLALAFALIALRPASAVTIEDIPSNVGDVCALVGDNSTPFVGERYTFEIPQGSDPTRVFTETYDLVDGATLSVEVPTNRKTLDFEITDGKVIGFAVFDKTNLRSGAFYDYSPDGALTGSVATPEGVERNIKAATVCYKTKADPTITTNGGSPNLALGVQNSATLTGGDSPGGTITFNVYSNSSCTGTPAGSEVVNVNGNGTYGPASITVTGAGDYYWQAVYSGDANNNPAQSTCGDVTTAYAGVLACGSTDSAVADEDGDRASFVEVIRLATGKPDCNVLLPYTLDITPSEVKFLFPDEFADENFFIRIDWAVSVGTADEILIGSGRKVAVDDVNFDPVQACADNDLGPGEIPDIPNGDLPTVTHPAGVPICLVAQVLNGTQTQWYSGEFDPQWR